MSVKGKSKASKKRTQSQSDSGSDSEHELFHYRNDRVRLMKEVLKILKLKKIKALAPPAIKKMDMEEINTLLLEELLGISNKRLKKIFEGQNADDESSSSDEDKIDIISLDSISDDEICFVDETKEDPKMRRKCRRRKHKIKHEDDHENGTKIKTEVKVEKDKEKPEKNKSKPEKSSGLENDKLLSVLELLELQARARAIRSQLVLEADKKAREAAEKAVAAFQNLDDTDDEAIFIETPAINEIIISSSDSEAEENCKNEDSVTETLKNQNVDSDTSKKLQENDENINKNEESPLEKKKTQKIKLIRNILVEPCSSSTSTDATAKNLVNLSEIPLPEVNTSSTSETTDKVNDEKHEESENIEEKPKVDTISDNIVHDAAKNKNITTQKLSNDDNENEDDVIRLDVVEIDGIDD